MKLREFEYDKDVQNIDKIFQAQPELGVPSLKHVFDNAVVTNGNDELIAYGVIKEFAEAVMIINRSATRKRDKANALKLVLDRAFNTCKDKNIEKLIIITSDEKYQRVLEKRYGFKEVQGKVLYLEIE